MQFDDVPETADSPHQALVRYHICFAYVEKGNVPQWFQDAVQVDKHMSRYIVSYPDFLSHLYICFDNLLRHPSVLEIFRDQDQWRYHEKF